MSPQRSCLRTREYLSAYARVNIAASARFTSRPFRYCTLLSAFSSSFSLSIIPSARMERGEAALWRTFFFTFLLSVTDISSVTYTTPREYTTSHISTQTTSTSSTTLSRDVVTVSVQYNVSTTDLETSHSRCVRLSAMTFAIERRIIIRSRSRTSISYYGICYCTFFALAESPQCSFPTKITVKIRNVRSKLFSDQLTKHFYRIIEFFKFFPFVYIKYWKNLLTLQASLSSSINRMNLFP